MGSIARSSSREVRIRVLVFSVVYFRSGTLSQKRVLLGDLYIILRESERINGPWEISIKLALVGTVHLGCADKV